MIECQNRVNDKELKKIQEIQKDLLRKFIRICEENDISYYVVYGTLLGAERHSDFIPWDDDIDVAIWRKDVEKIKKIARDTAGGDSTFVCSDEEWDFHCNVIKFQNNNTTSMDLHYFKPMGKYGIGIDVEIIDYTYSAAVLRKMKNGLLQFVYQLLYMKQYGDVHFLLRGLSARRKKALKSLGRYIKKNTLIKMMEHIAKWHGLSKKCCSIYTYEQHHDMRTIWFEKTKKLKFSDLMVSAPIAYKECLQCIYGDDYNELPPKSERVPRHLPGRYVNVDMPVKDVILGMNGTINIPEDKVFVIWGAGNMLSHYIKHFGIQRKPDFVVDNDEQKWGLEKHGCVICSPDRIKEYAADRIYLVICNIYAHEITRQIGDMGDYQHYVYWEDFVDRYMLRGSSANGKD